MYFEYDENEGLTKVSAEQTDICMLCDNFDSCPLVGAFESNMVYPAFSELTISECPMYELINISS